MSKLNLGNSLILDSDINEDGVEYKTGATYGGKPVYRMSGVKTGTWTAANNIELVEIANVDKIVQISGVTHFVGGSGFVQMPYIYSANFSSLDEYASFYCNGKVYAHLKNANGYENINWTVFYTKTTD